MERIAKEGYEMERLRYENDLLVVTKLFVPQASHPLIARPNLEHLIQEGLKRKLTLVSAPAGFGKTMLLTRCLQSFDKNDHGVAWVSLDANDDSPTLFWNYVFTALDNCREGMATRALASLQTSEELSPEYSVRAFLDEQPSTSRPCVLILDDYHVITNPAIHASLVFLLEHLPDWLHIALLTRSYPPLPLERWSEQNEMLEVRANQLRWNVEDAAGFFQHVLGISLQSEVLQKFIEQTEGWIVGLMFIGLSLQGNRFSLESLNNVCENRWYRYILDYLTEEVLQRQTISVQRFLIQTSLHDRLCASLCDRLMGVVNSQEVLEYLERMNVFVVSLDEQHRWYRYHPLFAGILRWHLEQTYTEDIPLLQERANQWYAQQGKND
jgi:LuxR family transcriptional regulator, maltose regulon positive regulatory protein